MSRYECTPHALMDALIAKRAIKSDAALARELKVAAPIISKIRNRDLRVGPTLILRIIENFDMPLSDIRDLLKATAPAEEACV